MNIWFINITNFLFMKFLDSERSDKTGGFTMILIFWFFNTCVKKITQNYKKKKTGYFPVIPKNVSRNLKLLEYVLYYYTFVKHVLIDHCLQIKYNIHHQYLIQRSSTPNWSQFFFKTLIRLNAIFVQKMIGFETV